MITLIASDFEERILPDEFTLGGAIVGLIIAYFVPLQLEFSLLLFPYTWGRHWLSVIEAAMGAGIVSGAIWLAGWIYEKVRHREGLGLGDVKMLMAIGAFLGLAAALMTLIIASLLGAVGGLIYIRLTDQEASTYELPFGSFLGASALGIAVYVETFLKLHPR
jgi:leader peptidase (prepilin peptidase)/N-methyltransferase